MATPVTYSGVSYSIPAFGDVGYAQGPGNLSSYLIALASGPQTTGGLFSLTAPLNFGPNFGLVAVNYTSTSANPATAGTIRLANTDTIDWRNFANSANLVLAVNASDQLTYQGVPLATTSTASGIVSSGTAGRITLYPATGTTVDDVYVQNAFGIDILIAAQAARSVALEYTIPNPGNAVAAATFDLLELAQTFTAAKTFTNQTLLLQETGGVDVVTIAVAALAAGRTYTIPDVLGAADFVMNAGVQTIAGVKTFSGGAGGITMSASTIAMGANKITGLANGTASTDATAFGQLRVFQIVQMSTTTQTSVAAATFTSTALTLAITPTSASNSIIAIACTQISPAGASYRAYASLFRGSTNMGDATAGITEVLGIIAAGRQEIPMTVIGYDSPATTSSTTYELRIKSDGTNSTLVNSLNSKTFLILIEVA